MRLFPEDISEVDPNLRWGAALRMQMLQELASDPQGFEARAPEMEESWKRGWRAVRRRNRKAEDAALVDRTRAELWKWWQGFFGVPTVHRTLSTGSPAEGRVWLPR